MTTKQITDKRYVVKLSDDKRERLNTLIRAGKHPARQLTKARILLKAAASETGEGWRDCEIAAAPVGHRPPTIWTGKQSTKNSYLI